MTTEIIAQKAWQLNEDIKDCNYNIRDDFLRLASMLVTMRDEKLYTALDCPTFESYLGTLGVEGNRSWLYKLLRAHDLFVGRLAIPADRLLDIGPSKLDIIAPVVDEGNVGEWLDKAEGLSKSDIINEVRQARGKPPLLPSPLAKGHISSGLSGLLKYKSYVEYAREQPCIVCGSTQVDLHHFPQGRARTDNMDKVVPLCRPDHTLYHENPLKFMHDFKAKIFDYFYKFVFLAWETA